MAPRRKAGDDSQVFARPVLDDARADAIDLDAIEASPAPPGQVIASTEAIAAAKLGIDPTPLSVEAMGEIADVDPAFLTDSIKFGYLDPAMHATACVEQAGGQELESKGWQKDGRRSGPYPHIRWKVVTAEENFRRFWHERPAGKSRMLGQQFLYELESRRKGYPSGYNGSIGDSVPTPGPHTPAAESRPTG